MTLEEIIRLQPLYPDHQVYTSPDGEMICPSCSGLIGLAVVIVRMDQCSKARREP